MSEKGATSKGRVRDKTEFLGAANTATALREFFESVGAKACSHSPTNVVKSLPLILISQLPRSGGSLLSQLFDGHPNLLVYPWEMRIGYPSKGMWPKLELDNTPDYLFATLFHAELAYMARKGYRKSGKAKHEHKRVKFGYSPIEHYENFVRLLPSSPTPRQVFDAYLSTFFQAWQPDANDASYVAGFVPRMAMHLESIGRFFVDYPDGRLISILRDPADWFASRRAHTKGGIARYDNIEIEIDLWNRMARTALHYQSKYGGQRFMLLSFRDLVTDREGTMRRICDWCGIPLDELVLEQTFDGNPIVPNTNFNDPVERLSDAVLGRSRELSDAERRCAYKLTEELRAKLLQGGCRL